jgi:hypothetical protein
MERSYHPAFESADRFADGDETGGMEVADGLSRAELKVAIKEVADHTDGNLDWDGDGLISDMYESGGTSASVTKTELLALLRYVAGFADGGEE